MRTKSGSGRKGKLILALTAAVAVGGSVLPINAAFSASSGNWGTDSGATFTTADIISGLNATDAVTNYAVYANSMVNSIHVEGNVKIGNYTAKGGEPLNQIGAVLSRNWVKGVHVYQTINTHAEEDTDFTVGAYSQDGSLIDTVKVTVPAGQKTGNTLITGKTNPAIFKALAEGTVTFSDGDGGTASCSVSPVTNSGYYTNEIGTIATESFLPPQYFDASGIGAVTYIEDMQNAGFNGTDFTFDSSTTVTVSNYKNADSNAARIVQKDGITAKIATTLNQLSDFSVSLADAKAGYNDGELSVINLKSTTGDLTSDLQALGYKEIQNGKGISDVINNDGLLLINIDTDGRDIYYLDQINIDGSNADSNNEILARHVIYNFIDSSSGSVQPYTGKITISNVAAGTVLAPKASFVHNGGMRGEIIADSYDHTGGSELHKDTLTIGGTVRAVVSDTVKTPAEPTGKPTTEPSEEPTVEPTIEPTVEPSEEPAAPDAGNTTTITFHAVKHFMPRKKNFKYALKDSGGTEIESASSDVESGNIEFAPLTYSSKDVGKTYTYTLTEDKGNSDKYDYDSIVYTIKVTVNKDKAGNLTTDTTVTDGNGEEHSSDNMIFNVTNPGNDTEPSAKPSEKPTAEPSEEPSVWPSEKTDNSGNSKTDSKSGSKTPVIVAHDQPNNSAGGTSTGGGSPTTVKKASKSPDTGVETDIGKLVLVMAGAAVVLVIIRKASK